MSKPEPQTDWSKENYADLIEFGETATGSSSPEGPRATLTSSAPSSDGPAEKKTVENPAKLCQYALYGPGPGFAPTTSTVSELPPGIYDLKTNNGGTWFNPKEVTTDQLLRLPDSKSDEVIAEIERFWELKDRFKEFGLTHKRGFLLWGPPGSGKTSTVNWVTRQLIQNGGVVLYCNAHPINVAFLLTSFRSIEPERPIIVILEDIDSYIKYYGETEVLSLLDGENSINNVIYLATTNYPENLDGRVVNRPSRFDKIVKIGLPNYEARLMYLQSRNISVAEGTLENWAKQTDGFSIAHLKEIVVGVVCFENRFEDELARLRLMAKTPRSDDPKGPVGFGGS